MRARTQSSVATVENAANTRRDVGASPRMMEHLPIVLQEENKDSMTDAHNLGLKTVNETEVDVGASEASSFDLNLTGVRETAWINIGVDRKCQQFRIQHGHKKLRTESKSQTMKPFVSAQPQVKIVQTCPRLFVEGHDDW